MRRPWWFRVCAAFAGLWFLVALTGPAALHACPMHDGVPAAAHHTGAHDVGAHDVGARGMGAHSTGGPARGDHRGGHACTCLGACCAPTAVLAARPASVGVAARVMARPLATPPVAPVSYHPSAPEHARPPSVGPPASHTA